MDYKKLLEPYAENGRTVEGQVTWLTKKGIAKTYIDQALIFVYDEVERGKVYPSGHDLDRALFTKSQELMKADMEVSLKQLELFHETLRKKWGDDLSKLVASVQKTPLWKKILTLGFAK
jgi:hypothetical protein